ncbi:hypothetical protein JOD31_001690 [Methylopila capsulata]|nr:hypothetical protein [Methylopila capsulata]MBM7851465.1 hypothetical protein [Methylopila capsulata]
MSRVKGVVLLAGLAVFAAIGHNQSTSPTAAPAPFVAVAPAPAAIVHAPAPPAPAPRPPIDLVTLSAPPEPVRAAAPLAEPPAVIVVPTITVRQSATLRREPKGKAAKAGSVEPDEVVIERGTRGAWRDVELSDGRRGWLPAAAFEAPKAAPSPASRKGPVTVEAPSLETLAAAGGIAALIVQESRASYSGSCGCPDDRDRGGRRCGGRSAYSRAGGRSLFCYPEDVPAAMIARREARR